MRGGALALAALGLLAGCSRQDPERSQPDARVNATGETASTKAVSARMRSPPTVASGSRLTGNVSPLNSGISGLSVRVTDTGTIIDLAADTLFEFDKADLTPAATEQLGKSAQMIRAAPAGTIRIVGHTDSKGDDAYNQKLSEARAHSVADWFSRQVGVRQREFSVSGLGEAAPVVPDETLAGKDDPIARAKNRRVEVILPNKS